MKKKNVLMSIIGIFVFIIMIGGVSYGYFVYNKDIAVVDLETGKISISFSKNNHNLNNAINQPCNDGMGKILPYYLDFTVNGVTDTDSIYYEIYIVPNDENTIDNKYINIYLTDQSENNVHGVSPISLLQPSKVNNGYRVYSETLVANNDGTSKNHTKNFRLRVWLNDSYKDISGGNFNYSVYMYAENTEKVNFMNTFPTEITNLKESIKEIYFQSEAQSVIDNKCTSAANNGGVCQDITYQNQGKVMAWLEPIENDMYIMYVESDGKTYLNTGSTLFSGYINVKKIEFSNISTIMVSNMYRMFHNCKSLIHLNLNDFDTKNVTSMFQMFDGCVEIISLNLSSFDVNKVESMSNMFTNCYELESIDLSSFNASSLINMRAMFYHNYKLKVLDLESFNTKYVTDMYGLFTSCGELEKIYVSSDLWINSSVIDSEYMFYDCINLMGGNNTTYSSSHVDAEYARIDGENELPGYFTNIADKPTV